MMDNFFYSLYGLTFASTLPCVDVSPLATCERAPPNVTIYEGATPEHLETTSGEGIFYEINAEECLLKVEAVVGVRYWIRHGCEIVIERQAGVSDDTVRLFLFGSALAALLYQRSLLPLHGSAIQTEQGALLFVGESGSGKSTLAAALHQRGYRVLTDDVSVIHFAQDKSQLPLVATGYPCLNLWADALQMLAPIPADATRLRPVLEKFQWSLSPENAIPEKIIPEKIVTGNTTNDAIANAANDSYPRLPPTLPVRAIFLLEPDNQETVRCEAQQGLSKLPLLQNHIYRPRFAQEMGKQAWLFQQLSTLAQQTPLYQLRRPRHHNTLDRLVREVEQTLYG